MRYWLALVAGMVSLYPVGGAMISAQDRSAPSVSLMAPADGQTLSGTVTVTAIATDSVRLTGVQFKLDGMNLGAEVRHAPYALAWNTATTVNGVHRLTAIARDAAGNIATAAAVTVVAQNPPIPRGVFNLPPAFTPVPDDVLSNRLVAGITVRGQWPRVERLEGVYDWSYFDHELNRAAAAHKSAILRVPAGGRNTPDWVYAAGVQIFSFIDGNAYDGGYATTVTIPVFWDPVLLQKKKQLIAVMGQRFGRHPAVALVAANCAAALTDDWNVPHTPNDVRNWLAAGYSSEKMIEACTDTIDAMMAAFPRSLVLMAVGQTSNALDPDPDYVAREVIDYARTTYPGRFIVQKNSLSAVTRDPTLTADVGSWQTVVDGRPHVAAQMRWPVTNDATCLMNGLARPCDLATTLLQAVTIGVNYDTQYQEIYQEDIRNPALADVIRYAADVLSAPTVPPGLTAVPASATQIKLSWRASTDTVGVVGYRILRDGVQIAMATKPGFRDQGLNPSTTYGYRVSAVDAVGNESPAASVSATTLKAKPTR